MEFINAPVKGIYRDIVRGPKGEIIFDRGWASNTIVTRCRVLLAGLMKNEGTATGIQHMVVGQGLAIWDSKGAPAPDTALTHLENPFMPLIPNPNADLIMAYLDDQDEEVAEPTSRLQITATLRPGYPDPLPGSVTYPLREFGLFGRFNGNDYMINCIRHPVILKEASTTLIRIVRLYF